ncbi:MAG: hypothetical protein R2848_09215 [Thermomicrobiales bacterium]
MIGTFRGPRDTGTGYVKLFHSMGMATGHRGRWTYVRARWGRSRNSRASRNGEAEIRLGADVEQIIVRMAGPQGSRSRVGKEIEANIVLSNADPEQTYLTLLDSADVPADYRRGRSESIKINPVMKINMAVNELPWFKALGDDAESSATAAPADCSSLRSTVQKAYEDARQGRPSEKPFMNIHMQSAVDPSVAPRQAHDLDLHAVFPVQAGRRFLGRPAR